MLPPFNVPVGLFPGRFQPFTNSHLERIEYICKTYPEIYLCVLIGDVGELNQANFLTVPEREFMIQGVLKHTLFADRVFIQHLLGATPDIWVDSILKLIPNLRIVFSDNPFVYQPFIAAGFECEIHQRTGIDCSELRTYPFEKWSNYIPKEVFDFIAQKELYKRLDELESTEKYPFMKLNR